MDLNEQGDINEQGWVLVGDFNRHYGDVARLQIEIAYDGLKKESNEMFRTGEPSQELADLTLFEELRKLDEIV